MVRSLKAKKPRKTGTIPATKRRKLDPTPSERQWLSWKPMQFCAVSDPRNNERVTFHLGENVLVLNHDWQPNKYYDPWDSWVGKIIAIRGNAPRNTWVKVQWYHSGKDVAERAQDQDTSSYGRYERSLGSEMDVQMISVLSINGKADVVEYDDTALDQAPILPNSFYTRRNFDSQGTIPPIIVDTTMCFCQQAYNPDILDPMHFCPRCERWYHEICLTENGHLSDKSPDQWTQDLLEVPMAYKARIPWDLLKIARVPIIRGGPMHGVVGNIKVVSEAREWTQLYARTPWAANCPGPGPQLNGTTLDRWLDGLEGVEVEELIYPGDEGCGDGDSFFVKKNIRDEDPPPFECPSCGRPI
ncbi:hypothetical protein EDB83DRAFT_2348698 [Lactarius deliciosus]|nr:hypothetical protein EDB83DRAFT_2348698 [Lactarius deliciosus]